MGTGVSIVASCDVPDVPKSLAAAEAALREIGLVTGDYEPDAAYAPHHGRVLRPAPGAAKLTGYGETLLEMHINGVAFTGPDYFNARAIGFAQWFDCPACQQRITDGDDQFGEQLNALGMAAVGWCDGARDTQAVCVMCDAASKVTQWGMEDPVFLADIAIEFYGWPALGTKARADGVWWKIDAISPLERAIGRPARVGGYKI